MNFCCGTCVNRGYIPQKPSFVKPTRPDDPLGTVNWREFGKAAETGVESFTTVNPALLMGCHALSAAAVSMH